MRISDWSSDVCSSDLRDILRALDLENRGRRLAVVIQFRIGEIGEDPDLTLARPGDQPLVDSQLERLGRRVRRIIDGAHDRARPGAVHPALEAFDIFVVVRGRPRAEERMRDVYGWGV